jgi:hypothetical protein
MLKIVYAFIFAVVAARAAEPKPNILWLVAEDMGVALGCYGQKEVATPNIDRLASAGVRFSRAYIQPRLHHCAGLFRQSVRVHDGNVPDHHRRT